MQIGGNVYGMEGEIVHIITKQHYLLGFFHKGAKVNGIHA